MGLNLLITLLAWAAWHLSTRVHLEGRAGIALSTVRGGLLGLTLALGAALGLTLTGGKMAQSPHYFTLMALGLSMVLVSFGAVTGLLLALKAKAMESERT